MKWPWTSAAEERSQALDLIESLKGAVGKLKADHDALAARVKVLEQHEEVHELTAIVPRGMEMWTDDFGSTLVVHGRSHCLPPCPVHAPAGHHMVTWPRRWHPEKRMVMRVCVHRIQHPDPNDIHTRIRPIAHECDGCCLED